jgi:Conserved region in glutamate synthase
MVNVGREAMLAVGCIQAMRCHTDRCPTGVATHSEWLMRGLDPALKSTRAASYLVSLRAETLSLGRACGARHPALIDPERIEMVNAGFRSLPLRDVFGYEQDWPLMSDGRREEIEGLIGAPAARPAPGPEAGEQAGFPRAGDPDAEHMDLRSAREKATGAG